MNNTKQEVTLARLIQRGQWPIKPNSIRFIKADITSTTTTTKLKLKYYPKPKQFKTSYNNITQIYQKEEKTQDFKNDVNRGE